jgi:bla regulator protein BlaR1
MMPHALIDHLWQSTLCAIAAALLTLALRDNKARVRYWVWFAASVKFAMPFSLLILLSSQFHWRHLPAVTLAATDADDTLQRAGLVLATPDALLRSPILSEPLIWPSILCIWAVGCVALLVRWVAIWARTRATLHAAAPAEIEAPIPVRLGRALLAPW